MDPIVGVLISVVTLILGAGVTYFLMRYFYAKKEKIQDDSAKKLLDEAQKKVDEIEKKVEESRKKVEESELKVIEAERKSAEIIDGANKEAKSIVADLKKEAEIEIREKKQEIANTENKLSQREANIDRRDVALMAKEQSLEDKHENLNKKTLEVEQKEKELQVKIDSVEKEIEKAANMSVQEAKDELLKRVEDKMSQEVTAYIKQKEDEAKETAETIAKNLIALAIDKYSQEVITERTVSTVALPSDEMKGRIIGREGRNIRTLEQMLGVDIIIDDTPEVISVSCFDPIRRETAKLALEYLIKDGRIQPGRIEEVVEKAKQDVAKSTHEAGINAAFKLGLPRINKDLLDIIGRLKYRTSYGQNVLDHSMQVAYLCGIMASELGIDQNLAKRAGLLHDIGKAVDFEMEGSHVEIGVRIAKKFGESDVVINAIESHHGDVPADSIIAHLVSAADTLSAARPGARSETLENYIKRISQLEDICKSYEGIQSSYAMQSGREVRVMVVPDKIDDLKAYKLAREIKERIENEMTYPGQIKVSVIREVRATEVAK